MAHFTSVRIIPWLESILTLIAVGSMASEKLGHPVPESYFSCDLNRKDPQQMHV